MGRGPGIQGHDSLALVPPFVVVVASRACGYMGREPALAGATNDAQPALCTKAEGGASAATLGRWIAAGTLN